MVSTPATRSVRQRSTAACICVWRRATARHGLLPRPAFCSWVSEDARTVLRAMTHEYRKMHVRLRTMREGLLCSAATTKIWSAETFVMRFSCNEELSVMHQIARSPLQRACMYGGDRELAMFCSCGSEDAGFF